MARVVDWDVREYGDSLAAMRRLRTARRAGEIPDTLILVEHPAVYTVGVQGAEGETFPPGIPVFHVERGGKGTFHGPGQLVGYPIVDLDARERNVRRFVHEVEELVVRAVGELGVDARRVPGRRGVWVGGERKIASVGVAVEQWVTFHGLALNVNVELAAFRVFHPCGFDGSVMTSMEQELHRPVTLDELRAPLRRAWEAVFGVPAAPATPSGRAPTPSPA